MDSYLVILRIEAAFDDVKGEIHFSLFILKQINQLRSIFDQQIIPTNQLGIVSSFHAFDTHHNKVVVFVRQ